MIDFKPGDDWIAPSAVTIDGITDFTGYTATVSIAPRDERTGDPGEAVSTVSGMAMTAEGGFLHEVSKVLTAEWPVGVVMCIDAKIFSPTGKLVTTETSQFRTVARVPEA